MAQWGPLLPLDCSSADKADAVPPLQCMQCPWTVQGWSYATFDVEAPTRASETM
ncbi:unnamed protein product [marine sediment metagenome]|uniref:Uncharacterized protein n=1 Tax=marine sediment metagenome TaxID=412755 RepID=X1SSJ8_9ZZZZ